MMKPSMTNFDTQGDEQRGSIRPLKNNYVRMKDAGSVKSLRFYKYENHDNGNDLL
jgi:hypothetical protein